MTEFYVIMLKRQDGKVYADLHKTTEKIYLTYDDAEKELNDALYDDALYGDYFYKNYYHIVRLIACLPETLDELAQGLPNPPVDAL
jgi:hypothetical protein